MIIRKNGQPRPTWELFLLYPPPHTLGHPAKFRVRAALDVIPPLKFQGYVVGPALGAVRKPVVESGHGSWGIYTKSARDAVPPAVLIRLDERTADSNENTKTA